MTPSLDARGVEEGNQCQARALDAAMISGRLRCEMTVVVHSFFTSSLAASGSGNAGRPERRIPRAGG